MSTTAAVKESEVEQIDHVLGEEYEHKPVPPQARRSLFSVTMVWIGFPMIITGAMTGSVLVLGMGFQRALIAMIIGNLIMFAYVGALGALGTKKGMNFALIASIVFGRKGYVFSSGLLSTLLLGWYAVQTGITGNLISATYHLNYVLMTVIAGLLYIAITFVGVRGLHYIGLVSVPLFVILGVWVAGDSVAHHGWAAVMSYAGADGKGAMSMGVGLTIVLTLFVDAGTVTADFNRWAKDLKGSLISTFSAFPFANLVAMLVGGVMTAALATPNANPFGADNMFGYMNDKQLVWLSVTPSSSCIAIWVRSARIVSTMRQPAGRASWAATCGFSPSRSGSSASLSPPAMCGPSSSSGSRCSASWCRRSAPSSWSISTCCG